MLKAASLVIRVPENWWQLPDVKLITKEELIDRLRDIAGRGWIQTQRHGNDGGVGNTLEDLLGLEENNLPIPNAAEWELKCQRSKSKSLLTLMHLEPSPRAAKIVPCLLLPYYGWQHQLAGEKHGENELSFRQTIKATRTSDRGFSIFVDDQEKKVSVVFDSRLVGEKHKNWLSKVEKLIGIGQLHPQPYWGFNDLYHKAGIKLLNCFLVEAKTRRINGHEEFCYSRLRIMQNFNLDRLIECIRKGIIFVDFDARTGHNHGTKFRIHRSNLADLYERVTEIDF